MSIAATHWALSQNNLRLATKSILFTLTFRANDDLTCFPSVQRIAADTGQTERSVQKGLRELEELGLIKRLFRKYDQGGNRSNLYRIVGFKDKPTPIPPQKTEPTGEQRSPSPPNVIHPGGEPCSPINKTPKTILEKNNNPPPENPPIVEPVVVVTEQAVLPPEPSPELTDITPDLTALEVFNEKEKNIVTTELKKVTDLTAQAVILFTLKTAMANNTVKNSPIALVRGLINKALDGVLVTQYAVAKMKKANEDAPPQRLSVEEKLRSVFEKHQEAVLRNLREQRYVYIKCYGNFYPSDFEKYGLIEKGQL